MKIVHKYIKELETEEFEEVLSSCLSLTDAVMFLRNHNSVIKLTLLCRNSIKASEIIFSRVTQAIDCPFEPWYEFPADAILAALLLVLIDAKHPFASFVAVNIMKHDAGMWWAGMLASNYLLDCELKKDVA